MKATVRKIIPGEKDIPCITAVVTFNDNDRERWIRNCEVEIFVEKEKIKAASLEEIERIALDQAYDFLSQALSARAS